MRNTQKKRADTVVVLDFETTGLSPNQGSRAIEIGAVLIEQGKVTDRFQQLMNPGFRINQFIENYTGITNQMLRKAPPCAEVMEQFADFIGDHNLVAHNASFDRRFLDAELDSIHREYTGSFACSMLVARRIYQNAPNHRLGNLVKYKNIPTDGVFHRALADSEMTSKLWLTMLDDIEDRYQISPISFSLMQQLSRKSKGSVHSFLNRTNK
ncbi:MAG: 3'-5' exonuclease [Chloroflexi bacterium]|nr:3'-5' exonuclease [Chloroflexota bacterium]